MILTTTDMRKTIHQFTVKLRAGRDSNPRVLVGTPAHKVGAIVHSATGAQTNNHKNIKDDRGPRSRGPLTPPGYTDLSRWAHAQQIPHNTPFKDYRNKNLETTLHYLTKTEADPRYSPVGNEPLSPKGHGFPGTYPPRKSKPSPLYKELE